jgi:hypothetical protein
MNPTPIVMILVSALALAGCVDGGPELSSVSSSPAASSAPPIRASTTAPAAAATEESGSLSIQVLTTELAPVAAAQVTLADTTLAEFTDEAGQVTFNELTPGTYTALVAKPGYRAQQDKGRLAEVQAGEITEIKLTLDPIPVVDATTSYYTTIPLDGFIGCAFEGAPGTIGYTTYCGRGLQTPAGHIKDPNDKTLFTVLIDNVQIQSVVLEGNWVPATGVTGQQLRMIWAAGLSCGATNSCLMTNNAHINVGGRSPLYGIDHEGEKKKLTGRFGEDPAKYPAKSYVEARAYCTTDCTGAAVVFQQGFKVWITMFYGKEAPADFRAVPS